MGTSLRGIRVVAVAALACGVAFVPGVARAAPASYTIGPITNLTTSCAGQNAEVEQAVDATLGYVYEEWMGCSGIAFARSTDGGKTFGEPLSVPGSVGSGLNAWDPASALRRPPVKKVKVGTRVYLSIYLQIRSAPPGIVGIADFRLTLAGRAVLQRTKQFALSSTGTQRSTVTFKATKRGSYRFRGTVTVNGISKQRSASLRVVK